MPGQGRVHTSSPTSPRMGRPASSYTSTAIPRAGPPSDMGLMGCTGWGDRKHAPTSVPPEMLITGQRPPPTTSKYQRQGPSFHGSPVEPRIRRADRSWARTGASPWGMRARTRVGLMPSTVTPWRSRKAHSRSGSGQSGAPSKRASVAPLARAAVTSHGPMIQPMSVNQNRTSPVLTSVWKAPSSATFTVHPPCTCTEPLGRPVVPDV